MSLPQVHTTLATTCLLFIGIIGLWALGLRLMGRALNSSWYGAAVVGEILLVVQGALGGLLYLQGFQGALARPFMHILYGVVALVTLPTAWSYFGSLEDEKSQTVGMALACFFLWGILLRANNVAIHTLAGG